MTLSRDDLYSFRDEAVLRPWWGASVRWDRDPEHPAQRVPSDFTTDYVAAKMAANMVHYYLYNSNAARFETVGGAPIDSTRLNQLTRDALNDSLYRAMSVQGVDAYTDSLGTFHPEVVGSVALDSLRALDNPPDFTTIQTRAAALLTSLRKEFYNE